MTSAELFGDDERIVPFVVTASVIESEQEIEQRLKEQLASPTRTELAFSLLDEVSSLSSLTGWSRIELARLFGCEHPDPSTWLRVEERLLQQSIGVLSLIRAVAEASAERPVEHLISYLETATDNGAVTRQRINDNLDLFAIAERRTAARESITLSIEVLSRFRGDVNFARLTLRDPEWSASDAVAGDRLGTARDGSLARFRQHRIDAIELRRLLSEDVEQRDPVVEAILRAAGQRRREG